MTTYNNFVPVAGVPPAFSLSLSNLTAVQNAVGLDGSTITAWRLAQQGSGAPRLSLTIPTVGPGTPTTYYASVNVRVPSAGPIAYPGLVFSSDNQSGAGPAGFSVVLNELNGDTASSYNVWNGAFPLPPPPFDHSWANWNLTYGAISVPAGAFTFYNMWVSLTDQASSTELTVELYPASYGIVGVGEPFQVSGQIGSSAIFTNIVVSTTHP